MSVNICIGWALITGINLFLLLSMTRKTKRLTGERPTLYFWHMHPQPPRSRIKGCKGNAGAQFKYLPPLPTLEVFSPPSPTPPPTLFPVPLWVLCFTRCNYVNSPSVKYVRPPPPLWNVYQMENKNELDSVTYPSVCLYMNKNQGSSGIYLKFIF
jgi:hypothetical protein